MTNLNTSSIEQHVCVEPSDHFDLICLLIVFDKELTLPSGLTVEQLKRKLQPMFHREDFLDLYSLLNNVTTGSQLPSGRLAADVHTKLRDVYSNLSGTIVAASGVDE